MRKIREILRLKLKRLSNRQIAKICNASPTTVAKQIKRIDAASISYKDLIGKPEDEIMNMLFDKKKKKRRELPDMSYIHKQLKIKGVTLQLLWEEYKEEVLILTNLKWE